MIKKTIKYTDFLGTEREEDFRFHISKAKLLEKEFNQTGGLEYYVNKIVQEQDRAKLLDLFKGLILESFGVLSDDGKRFIQNKQVSDEFEQTEAFDILLMELLGDSNKAADFVNGILPADIQEQVKASQKPNPIPPSVK